MDKRCAFIFAMCFLKNQTEDHGISNLLLPYNCRLKNISINRFQQVISYALKGCQSVSIAMWQSKLYRDWIWLVYLCLIQLWTTSCIISKTVYRKHCMLPGAQTCPTRLKIISKQGTNLICCQILLWLSAVFIYAECNTLK